MCVCVSRKLHLRRQCVMKTHETPYNIKAKRKVEPPPIGLLCILPDSQPVRIWRKKTGRLKF